MWLWWNPMFWFFLMIPPTERPSHEDEERLVADLYRDLERWNKLEMGDY